MILIFKAQNLKKIFLKEDKKHSKTSKIFKESSVDENTGNNHLFRKRNRESKPNYKESSEEECYDSSMLTSEQ